MVEGHSAETNQDGRKVRFMTWCPHVDPFTSTLTNPKTKLAARVNANFGTDRVTFQIFV